MDTLLTIVCIAAAACVAGARCPDLEPPANGVLKCQDLNSSLLCTATCYEGFQFENGQRVEQRQCLPDADAWLMGPADLPNCLRSCRSRLIENSETMVTVSSSLNQAEMPVGPETGMLFESTVWRPVYDNILQFIEVDLRSPHDIRGWIVRGDQSGSYVRLFRLLFSLDGTTWTPYSDGRVMDKFFTGSFDSFTEVTQMLSRPQVARYIRVNPLSWHQHIALHFDLVGCAHQSNPGTLDPPLGETGNCKAPLPPVNGAVNCERNGTHVVCTAYCLDSLTFRDVGPVIDMTCDAKLGLFTHTPLPACVEPDTTRLPFVNISGPCLQEEGDCFHRSNGNYQYCGDCHYFSTCSEGYFFVRPCPEHLQYDSEQGVCDYNSGTCNTKRRTLRKQTRLSHSMNTSPYVRV